jgi:hypothetical protein
MDPMRGHVDEPTPRFLARWWDEANGRRYVRYALAVGKRKLAEGVGAVASGDLPQPPQAFARRTSIMESGILAGILPQEAIDFLRSLSTSGIDPAALLPAINGRSAFTLALTTDAEILERVKNVIIEKLESGDVGNGAQAVQEVLDAAGLTPTSNGYAATVFRTNAMSAYNAAAQQALNEEIDSFPVWRYSNPDDSRSRPHHAEKNGNYYPSTVAFEDVRGREIGDVANCRCVQVPVLFLDWEELRASGARIADGYPDVVMESAVPLREMKDASGHEHAADGRFGTVAGEHDKKDDSSDADRADVRRQWADHAKAKEAHAKEVAELKATHEKALAAHADKVAEITAAHKKEHASWQARDAARSARYNQAMSENTYSAHEAASADGSAADAAATWEAAYGKDGHLQKSLDLMGATDGEKAKAAAVAERGKAAIERARAKHEKAKGKHAEAVKAADEFEKAMPPEPVEPDPPDEPDAPVEPDGDASPEEHEQYRADSAEYDEKKKQYDADSAAYEKAHAKWEKDDAAYQKASEKLDALREKADETESERDEAAETVDDAVSEHQEKVGAVMEKVEGRVLKDVEKESDKDPEPEEPDYPEEPDEPEYPDEPEEPDVPDVPEPDEFDKKGEQ